MTSERIRSTALLAAGVVAGGILTGTLAAHAADQASDSSSSAQVADHRRGLGGLGGPGGFRGPGGADLAKALGVSEDKLDAALKAVREATKPTGKPDSRPSDAERAARQEQFAAALAKQLDLSEAKVKAALDDVRTAHQADHRKDLTSRLAAAVKAGTLTSDDQASVLKAYDAGVLGGGPRP